MPNYYELLEVSPNASPEVLKKAYYTLIQQYHPDQFHSNYKQFATQRTQALNEAYRILSDPIQRKQYDRRLALQQESRSPYLNAALKHSALKILFIGILVYTALSWSGHFMKLALSLPLVKWIVIPLLLYGVYRGFRLVRRLKARA